MKKIFFIIVSVLILASCSMDGNSNRTVGVSLGAKTDSEAKKLTPSFPAFNQNSYYWTYTAVKRDGGQTVGQTSEERTVKMEGPGLGALENSFSVGEWTFTLYAYTDQAHSKKVFTGSTDVAFSGSNAVEEVTADVAPLSTGSGTLAIKKMSEDAVQTVKVVKYGDATETNLWTSQTFHSQSYTTQDLACGFYVVTVTLKNETGTTVAEDLSAVTIYANLTTTLGGDLDE